MHVGGPLINKVNVGLHIEKKWKFSTFYNKDAHLRIMRVCDNCLLLSKCQTTFGAIGVIQMLGSWLNACTKLCSQTHKWLFKM
jgi:hypothetical protein